MDQHKDLCCCSRAILQCDNAGEHLSQIMQHTLNALKINQITTYFYYPQSNTIIERFHRTLHDILSKLKDSIEHYMIFYLN
jgi:transposase InsO family protein